MKKKFDEEFRKEHPETIGETDQCFDLDNYADWMDKKLTEARERLYIIKHQYYIPNQYEQS